MTRLILALTACTALIACQERIADIPPSEDFPPVGLSSTAVWLQEREALLPQAATAFSGGPTTVRTQRSVTAPRTSDDAIVEQGFIDDPAVDCAPGVKSCQTGFIEG